MWAAAVVALYIFTVAWKLKEVWYVGLRCNQANAFAVTALAVALLLGGGASLQLTVCPNFYGGVLLGCSLALVFGMKRREKLLQPSGRAVLVTGEEQVTHTSLMCISFHTNSARFSLLSQRSAVHMNVRFFR